MNKQILILAKSIVASRELCGNESEALRDAANELGITLTPQIRQEAFEQANARWRKYQADAGVTYPSVMPWGNRGLK